jgi:6-pyruvoyltetrahydropterin/6-carboxytetrahydropterin synthase
MSNKISKYQSTKVIELGSCAFRQWRADHSHCKYLHGYQLKAKLWFGCNNLDDKNWSVDFGGLKELKDRLKKTFDHTTTVALDDPKLELFKQLDTEGIIQLKIFENGVGIERCAEFVYELANKLIYTKTDGRCWVDKVEVFEHEDNSATYALANDTSTSTSYSQPVKWSVQKHPDKPESSMSKTAASNLPAQVGNKVTQGKSDWFTGTSWG